ncbi:MAG: hypothetical protein FJW90_09040 [Actinobacteria bacterium]|nr:hypothetical protein [Actinomycetota bacterium]
MEGTPNGAPRGPGPPPDSDLVVFPLLIGIVIALAAIGAAFWLIGAGAGIAVLVAVIAIAVVVAYRVLASSEVKD